MLGIMDVVMEDAVPVKASPDFSVLRQKVDLDLDFATRSLKGSTEITLQPLVKDLKQIALHCRQCKPTSVQAGGITAKYEHEDPYKRLRMPSKANIHQHKMLKDRIYSSLQPNPEPEVIIAVPAKLKIQELQADPAATIPTVNSAPSLRRQDSETQVATAETPTAASAAQTGLQFAPIKLHIEFEVEDFQDGLHWIGCDDSDKRYPYVYTKSQPSPGNTSCIFPCVDDATSRCSWDISIRCPRTLGDAFRTRQSRKQEANSANGSKVAVMDAASRTTAKAVEYSIDLGDEEAALDLVVVCIGEQLEDVVDTEDDTRHTVSFSLSEPVTARHVGFAVGPFERIDMSGTRSAEEEEKMGQSAVKVEGLCLPQLGEDVRNTCYPITTVIDNFGVQYGSFAFPSYQMLFIDDLPCKTVAAAGLSICNAQLLFPPRIIEPLEPNTRILIRAVAEQWAGVSLIPQTPSDAWAVAAIAGYMSDLYGKTLFGNNAYRWQQKQAAERVYDLDADRPSIEQHGSLLHLDPSIREFMDLKSALVLFILDRRLLKASGSSGVQRIINRIFLNTKTGSLENGELSTAEFLRTCERLSHAKLESFFRQWVSGAGCPIFEVSQRFNKKKLVVEMTIVQRQNDRQTKPPFAPNNFMREIKEHVGDVWAPETQPVFIGPMTIRIHEADGTPYEHIVEIKEQVTKLEIPYNTKYKRLKRSRRQRDRAAGDGNAGDGEEGALLYCLGDILDTEEEKQEWQLVDWGKEAEEQMGQESYEWIRMDADFEWIGKIHLSMPTYMYVSQLQQDRDVAAQYDSMKWLMLANPHHVSLSILVRTLMDTRYFHGLRTMAARGLGSLSAAARVESEGGEVLKQLGQFHLVKSFETLFCFPGESMPKPNDWEDRTNFILQCEIPRAMALLRDAEGKVPQVIRSFFIEKLRFNDNSDNEYSDCHYVATLMTCLADSMVVSHRDPQPTYAFNFGDDDEPMEEENPDEPFEQEGIKIIERYRRIDEWETTYQNVYSVTALECLQKLTKAGLVKNKAKEILQYTRPLNSDLVRIAAFRCLTETGFTRKPTMMRYLINSIADAPSPFVRSKLVAVFGEALGHIALGDEAPKNINAPAIEAADGLVIEQEVSSEARQLDAMRKTTPEGAITALRLVLEHDEVFKKALWYAITSPILTIDEIAAFCDVAALLYPAIASLIVVLKLPRSITKCESLGRGKMRFLKNGPYRTKPIKPLDAEDWQEMQVLGLMYSGPKPVEHVKRRQSSADEAPLMQIREMQMKRQQEMAPPAPSAVKPSLAPEVQAKAPIKISLGAGNKRKASVDPAVSGGRAASPKTPRSSIDQTAGSFSKATAPKRSPSVVSQARRRGSTPGTHKPALKRAVAKLKLTPGAQARVAEILARAPQPGANRLPPLPRSSMTPSFPQPTSPAFYPPANGLQSSFIASPAGSFLSASPAPAPSASFNLGGFRSYDPAPLEASASEVKQESAISPSVASAQPLASPPLSMPPPANPPKKSFKLKLGRKPGMDNAGAANGGGSARGPQ